MTSAPDGFRILPGYLARKAQHDLIGLLRTIADAAPFFQPRMPRTGKPLSVEMTNCGPLGWVADKDGGYRYQATHPDTGRPWPAIPAALNDLWDAIAGYPHRPEACLINHYRPGTRMGLHVDADEADFAAPVVSVSLGDDCLFRIGGTTRSNQATWWCWGAAPAAPIMGLTVSTRRRHRSLPIGFLTADGST